MKLVALLIVLSFAELSFAAKQNTHGADSDGNCGEKLNSGDKTIFVKIEEDDYAKSVTET